MSVREGGQAMGFEYCKLQIANRQIVNLQFAFCNYSGLSTRMSPRSTVLPEATLNSLFRLYNPRLELWLIIQWVAPGMRVGKVTRPWASLRKLPCPSWSRLDM